MATKVALQELMKFYNWVAYEIRPNPDNPFKPKKMPINPHTGFEAKSNDAATWGDYQTASLRAEQIKGGIGFMFGVPGNPCGIAGIDLDDCFDGDDDGHVFLTPDAAEIVSLMDSYTEYSPSGNGLHILFKLSRSLHDIEPSINTGKKNTRLGIEIYDSGRYFTFTDKTYGELKPIAERTEQAAKIVAKYFTKQDLAKKQEAQTQITYTRPDESDSELWQKLFNMPNGARVKKLYEGDISGYDNDDSRADAALCVDLAYITNNDVGRIERMFYQSVLANRDKWRNRPDYRLRTIENAIEQNRKNEQEQQTSPANNQQQPQSQTQNPTQSESKPEIKFNFNAAYLDSAFEADMKDFQRYSGRKTGFANLDGEGDEFKFQKINLYPGLYVIGAVSSLGKSTFCLQMADQLAQRGEHVLFFAFEQSRFELVSKSLARLSQPEDAIYDSNPTAIEIREGRITPELREAMQKYKELAEHYAIIECDFMYDVSTIIDTVSAYIKQFGVKPVVFVDYLQLIRSNNPKLTASKDIVDDVIRGLKQLQKRNELIMFVVSSLNRQNYLTTIDFESFKESGAIEYTADVVIGLQLAVMNDKLFESDSKTTTTKKRKVVKAAKAESPRQIELSVLKNRYGVSNASYYFNYYPKYDLFIPASQAATTEAITRLTKSLSDDNEKTKPI